MGNNVRVKKKSMYTVHRCSCTCNYTFLLCFAEFPAHAIQAVGSLRGPCRIALTGAAVTVKKSDGTQVATWPYNSIRQFGAEEELRQFTFVSGRRGPFGVSEYAFELSEEMLSGLQHALTQFTGAKFWSGSADKQPLSHPGTTYSSVPPAGTSSHDISKSTVSLSSGDSVFDSPLHHHRAQSGVPRPRLPPRHTSSMPSVVPSPMPSVVPSPMPSVVPSPKPDRAKLFTSVTEMEALPLSLLSEVSGMPVRSKEVFANLGYEATGQHQLQMLAEHQREQTANREHNLSESDTTTDCAQSESHLGVPGSRDSFAISCGSASGFQTEFERHDNPVRDQERQTRCAKLLRYCGNFFPVNVYNIMKLYR